MKRWTKWGEIKGFSVADLVSILIDLHMGRIRDDWHGKRR